jgi:type II secretion system-associated lipoprotein
MKIYNKWEKMKRFISLLFFVIILTISCSSFIKDEQMAEIEHLEKDVYILKDDVKIGGRSLKAGDKVMIIITYDDDWVKAEAYLESAGKLKGERVRILYMFEGDFPEEEFNIKKFKNELFKKISVKK